MATLIDKTSDYALRIKATVADIEAAIKDNEMAILSHFEAVAEAAQAAPVVTAAPVDETGDLYYQPLPAEYYGMDDSGGAAIIEDDETDWDAQDAYNAQWERDDNEAAYVATLADKGTRLATGRDAKIIDAAAPDQRPDIVRRLADAGLSLNSTRPTQTEQDVIMALIDAADVIIALRAELAVAQQSAAPRIELEPVTSPDHGGIREYRWVLITREDNRLSTGYARTLDQARADGEAYRVKFVAAQS